MRVSYCESSKYILVKKSKQLTKFRIFYRLGQAINIMAINVTHTKPEFEDERVYITRLVNDESLKLKAVLYITSKAGTQRGNHYHKTDYNYVYCLSGKFKYSEKDMFSRVF